MQEVFSLDVPMCLVALVHYIEVRICIVYSEAHQRTKDLCTLPHLDRGSWTMNVDLYCLWYSPKPHQCACYNMEH